jgi:hypothetical protein
MLSNTYAMNGILVMIVIEPQGWVNPSERKSPLWQDCYRSAKRYVRKNLCCYGEEDEEVMLYSEMIQNMADKAYLREKEKQNV